MAESMCSPHSSFIKAFGLGKGGVVCIVGAGGKTSLLFQLASEAKSLGLKTLVSTTTKIMIPDSAQCDDLDLTGVGFIGNASINPGVYVAGRPVTQFKMRGLADDVLYENAHNFDLVLLEADGAARKPLKGWLETEPVIPTGTTHTIGLVDIQTIGKTVSEDLIHRLDCFSALTGAYVGDLVQPHHLEKVIRHEKGLFLHSVGKKKVYINKVESAEDRANAELLQSLIPEIDVFMGSLRMKRIHP